MKKMLRSVIFTFVALMFILTISNIFVVAQESADEAPKPSIEKFSLQWGFKDNQAVNYEITEETQSDIENRGSTITEKKKLTTNIRLWCKSRDEEKKMLMYYIYDRVRFEQFSSLFPNVRRFDSNKQEDNAKTEYDVALKPYSEIINKNFTYKLEPNGKVSDVKGYDKLINEIFENLTDPIYVPLKIDIQKTFSNKMMQKTLETFFSILPKAPVSIGESWTREDTVKILYVGDVKVKSTFLLQNVEKIDDKLIAQIHVSATFEQVNKDQEASEVLPEFKLKGTITDSTLEGKISFNITDGQLGEYSVKQVQKFTMEATSEGRKLNTEGTLTNNISLKPTPIEKPAEKETEEKPAKEKPENSSGE